MLPHGLHIHRHLADECPGEQVEERDGASGVAEYSNVACNDEILPHSKHRLVLSHLLKSHNVVDSKDSDLHAYR